MNWVNAIPLGCRLAVVALLGAYLGALANGAIETLAIGPANFGRPSAGKVRKRWSDRVPILGWFMSPGADESRNAGSGFRPLVIEVLFAFGAAALYWWEIDQRGLLPTELRRLAPQALAANLHAQWFCHLVLFWLMLVASVIDFDEKLIPDAITVPGTLFGLLVATLYPLAMLPVVWDPPIDGIKAGFLHLTSPLPWPDRINGWPHFGTLAIALGCWWAWCVALMHRTWYGRHGCCRAVRLMLARLVREPSTRYLTYLGLAGSVAIAAVWFRGSFHWMGLLTALVGMAAGGGFIWAVRISAFVVLRKEAMGFGDVTLMAMIGAFLGWQSSLVIFFLAPLAGVVVAVLQWLLRRDNEIWYGPFLCLAATVWLVRWQAFWAWFEPVLAQLGPIIPLMMAVCVLLMAVLLGIMRAIRVLFHVLFG